MNVVRDNSCYQDRMKKWEAEAVYTADGTHRNNRHVSTLSLCLTGWPELHREVVCMRITCKHRLHEEEVPYLCQPSKKTLQNKLSYIKASECFFCFFFSELSVHISWPGILFFDISFNRKIVRSSFSRAIPVSSHCNLVNKISSLNDYINMLYI